MVDGFWPSIILHDAIITHISIKDMVFPEVALSGHKCGVSSFFQYRKCNSKFILLIKGCPNTEGLSSQFTYPHKVLHRKLNKMSTANFHAFHRVEGMLHK